MKEGHEGNQDRQFSPAAPAIQFPFKETVIHMSTATTTQPTTGQTSSRRTTTQPTSTPTTQLERSAANRLRATMAATWSYPWLSLRATRSRGYASGLPEDACRRIGRGVFADGSWWRRSGAESGAGAGGELSVGASRRRCSGMGGRSRLSGDFWTAHPPLPPVSVRPAMNLLARPSLLVVALLALDSSSAFLA